MTEEGKPSEPGQSEHGTLPTAPSDGPGPTPSDVSMLCQAVMRQADTIDNLVIHNQELMDRLLETPDDDDGQDKGLGVDMAGKPIRTS